MGDYTNNKLVTTEYVKILDCICEGEIEGLVNGKSSIYLDDVPLTAPDLQNEEIPTAIAQWRNGTYNQTPLPGFDASSNVRPVNSTTIYKGYTKDGVTQQPTPHTERVTGKNIDAVVVTLEWTSGLKVVDLEDGTTGPYGSRFKIEYKYGREADPAYRYMPSVQYSKTDAFALTSYFSVGNSSVDANSAATPVSTGGKIILVWIRPPSGKQYICGNDGDYDLLCDFYAGDWIKVQLGYRLAGSTGAFTDYGDVINITAESGSSSSSYDRPVGRTSQHVYYPIFTEFDTEEQYEYQIEFVSAQISTDTLISFKQTKIRSSIAREIYFEGKGLSAFKKDYYFRLPESYNYLTDNGIDIRVSKISNDDEWTASDRSTKTTEFRWSALTEIIEEKFNYPYTALVSLEFNAEAYQQLPKRSYDVKLLKVQIPDNYDPITRQYGIIWTGGFKTAWSDNPAWAFYDMVTQGRYGLGQYIKEENINKWTLYEIAKWCDIMVPDSMGGEEPRYVINTYITRQEEALVLLRHMASIFRGMIYWMDNQITASYDHPDNPVCMFTNVNVVDGDFTYTGSSKETRYNTAYVSWNDPSLDYDTVIETVEDIDDIALRGEINSTELVALGCTSRGQARRAGRALLATERETVVFQSSLDNIGGKPGVLMEIYDRNRANIKYSGRALSFNGNEIFLDGDSFYTGTFVSTKTYHIRIVSNITETKTLPNGDIVETNLPKVHTYSFPNNNYRAAEHRISVNGRNDEDDLVKDTIGLEAGCVWAIYELDIKPQLFRIISIEEEENDLFKINGLAFNQTKQAWIDLEEPMTIPIFRKPRKPLWIIDNVFIEENIKAFGSSIGNVVSFEWGLEPNSKVKEFRVEYKIDSIDPELGDWVYAGTVNDSSRLELEPNTPKGIYTARVAPILFVGTIMPFVYSEPTEMKGNTYPPKDVTGFRSNMLENGILRLSWDKSPELDFAYYEIRNGLTWENAGRVFTNITNTHFDVPGDFDLDFWIKVFDDSGNESPGVWVLGENKLELQLLPPVISGIIGKFIYYGYELSWSTQEPMFPVHYTEIREGPVLATSKFIVNSYNNLFDTSDFENWGDSIGNTHTYWLTPLDNHGNRGVAVRYDTVLHPTKLDQVAITAEWLRVYFYFNRIDDGEFHVDYVELKSNGVHVANIYGEYFSYRAPTEGSYTFELTPYDIAGRKGIPYTQTLALDDGGIIYALDTSLRMDSTIPNTITYSIIDKTLTGPVADVTETWTTHFASRGYSTIQDQIDAGYPYYLIPASTATYTEVYAATSRTTTTTRIEVRPITVGSGSLTLKVYQKDGAGAYTEITGTLTNGKYVTSGAFTDIKVDYIFTAVSGNTLTLQSALIIGETS